MDGERTSIMRLVGKTVAKVERHPDHGDMIVLKDIRGVSFLAIHLSETFDGGDMYFNTDDLP